MLTTIDVVLPAGGRISGDFAAEAGAEVKALIPLCGRTVLERTLATLRATPSVGRIVVIGPEDIAAHPTAATLADAVLPEGGPSTGSGSPLRGPIGPSRAESRGGSSGPANVLRGLQWLHDADAGHADSVLVLATDLPFLTPKTIKSFVNACPPDLDICLPLTRREEFAARFPDLPIEYVRLRDGEWTMGCAFLVNPVAIIEQRVLIERVFAARKSQFGMVRLLGPSFILRFLAGRLTVGHIERRCQSLLGCSGVGVRGCAPELALDIDLPQEYHYAAAHCEE